MAEIKLSKDEIHALPWEQRKQIAKEMYYKYSPITQIADKCSLKLPTVKSWVYGDGSKKAGWKIERETAKNDLLKDLSSDKRGMVQNMANSTLYLLYDFVEKTKEDVVKKKEKIDLKTAEKLTGIIERLHKIVQNEIDSSVEEDPNFKKPSTPQELRKRVMKADPFASDEEVVELANDEDEIILDD